MIKISKHFIKRYRQRVAKTNRIKLFANRAFHYGLSVDDIKQNDFRKMIDDLENTSGSEARLYNGFIYWFAGNTAVTVYAMPGEFRNKIK